MAYRELFVIEVRELLRLWSLGHGYRAVARLTGVDRKTVRRYVEAATAVRPENPIVACRAASRPTIIERGTAISGCPGAAGLLWAAAWALMAQSTPAQPDEGHIVVPPRPARCVLQLHRILANDRNFF